MATRIRTSGAWYAPPNGNVRVRYAGSWRAANNVYVKIGGIGAGYWYDSGYRGYPAVPSTPWVTGWDYNNINVGWSGGSGGAPVAYWQLQRLDVNGNQMNLDNYGGGGSNNYAVNWDTRYQFRVRSVSTGGLVSDWSGLLRVGIGHPQQDTYGYVTRTRGWSSDHQWNYRFIREKFEWQVGDNISLNAIHWINARCGPPGNQGSSIVQRTSSNRLVSLQVASQFAGSAFGSNADVPSGTNGDVSFGGQFGGSLWWGLYPTANDGNTGNSTGWSATNVALSLYVDDVYIEGTEYYPNWELTSSIPAQGNYYW